MRVRWKAVKRASNCVFFGDSTVVRKFLGLKTSKNGCRVGGKRSDDRIVGSGTKKIVFFWR